MAETESRAPYILLGNLLPFLLGTIIFSGRVYSRAFILRIWGWDDYLLFLGWTTALANCIMACLATKYGSGAHMDTIPMDWIEPGLKLSYGTLIVYQLSLCLTKSSICALYLRVFTTSRSSRVFLYSVLGFIVLTTVILECVSMFQCSPVRGVWDINLEAKCINTIGAFYASIVENIMVDLLLMSFAMPKILRLNMAPRQKYALVVTVGLGGVPVIASIIRAVRVSAILTSTDKTYVAYDSSIWSAVDANVSIICASTPALKPLLRQIAPGFMGSSFGTSQSGTSGEYYKKSWLRSTRDTDRGFELHSGPRHADLHNHSQTEFAKGPGKSDWTMSARNMERDDDAISEDSSLRDDVKILKSVTVAVTHASPSPSEASSSSRRG